MVLQFKPVKHLVSTRDDDDEWRIDVVRNCGCKFRLSGDYGGWMGEYVTLRRGSRSCPIQHCGMALAMLLVTRYSQVFLREGVTMYSDRLIFFDFNCKMFRFAGEHNPMLDSNRR